MQGSTRKIVQAVCYEAFAVLLVSPVLAFVFDERVETSGALAIVISLFALSWNYAFNSLFERWEARHASNGRPPLRRILHAAGFEGGLALLTIPLIAWWLKLSLWQALVTDFSLLVFFFFYSLAFHWIFDLLFGLPESANRAV